MKTLALLGLGLSAVTSQFINTGFSDATTPIVVNGTTFRVYTDNNYPLSYDAIQPRDYCNPVPGTSRGNATSCSYLGNDYCCGTWQIDPWYQADISFRMT